MLRFYYCRDVTPSDVKEAIWKLAADAGERVFVFSAEGLMPKGLADYPKGDVPPNADEDIASLLVPMCEDYAASTFIAHGFGDDFFCPDQTVEASLIDWMTRVAQASIDWDLYRAMA